MKRESLALGICALAVGLSLKAAEPAHTPTPAEFAAHLPLKVSGDNGVVQLQLPLEVYQHARTPDLADLRVYNSGGQVLPYALHRPSYRTRISTEERRTTLFPIVEPAGPAPDEELKLNLGMAGDGTLTVRAGPAAPAPADARLAALIIDLGPSSSDEMLESLSFELPEAGTYRARIAVERSDDLQLWDGAAHGNIDWLRSSDASGTLVHDRIDLADGSGRYLRLRWIDGEPLQFAAVRARWRSASVPVDPMLEVRLAGVAGRVGGDYSYAASPAIVATRIGLDLAEPNTVMPVQIGYYRPGAPNAEPWLDSRVETTFYRLLHQGRERVSSRILIAPMGGAEWIVRPRTAGQPAPTLVLSWQPQTLVFTAQGQGFVLAIGADPERIRHWLGGPSAMGQVAPGFSLDEIAQLERAEPGTLSLTPPPAEAISAPQPAPDTDSEARKRRYLLWAILGLGVILLAWLTFRLYMQMQEGRE